MTAPGSPEAPRRSLLETKLHALVRGRWPEATPGPIGALGDGVCSRDGDVGWVLFEGEPALGAALAWATRFDIDQLHLIAGRARVTDDAVRVAARRARAFAPAPTVWVADGRDLVAVEAAHRGDPAGVDALPPGADGWVRLLLDHGVEPVVEHGVLRGDVLGLEVARLVPDDRGGWTLAVGVGDHDREARRDMAPDETPGPALARVVDVVRARRSPTARLHPANTLAPERWLRSVVVQHPDLIGVAELRPVAPPVDRTDLRLRSPAPAVGTDDQGRPVVIVCSTGIDVELVPAAADSRLLVDDPAAPVRLLIVVPDGDDHPATRRVAARLAKRAEVVTVERSWPGLTPLTC